MCVFIIVSVSIHVLFISSVHNYVIDIVSMTGFLITWNNMTSRRVHIDPFKIRVSRF